MFKNRIYLNLFALLFVWSCQPDLTLTYDTVRIASSDMTECLHDVCADLVISYPYFKEPQPLANVVNSELEEVLLDRLVFEGQQVNTIAHAAEAYVSNALNAYPEDSVTSAQELSIQITVAYASNKVLSLQNEFYEFSGGAHGIGGITYDNYNPTTGERLLNEAIFNDVTLFTAFAKAEFINTYGSLESFWFEDKTFTLPQNIGFTDEGLILYYNVYEIAPYAEGNFKLQFPWEAVEEYLLVR